MNLVLSSYHNICSSNKKRGNIFIYAYRLGDQHDALMGAQWLSGRVLDSRPKGCGFEPHRRHCVVVLEQDTFILA